VAAPAVVGPASPPAAEAPAPTPSEGQSPVHHGFYFRGAVGAGLAASASGHPDGDNNSADNANISGGSVDVELGFGGTVYPGLAVGGMVYGSSFPSPTYSISGMNLSGGTIVLSSIGPFADWYFDPAKGLHAQAAIGFAALQAKQGSSSNPNSFPPQDYSGTGGSFMAGIGYDWWVGSQWSLGLLGRVQYLSGSLTDSTAGDPKVDLQAFVTSILATATYY
jgi:hypothetical protein